MISTPTPPHRTEYSGSLSDFRASTRSNSLRRYNTTDKNTRDRGEIGPNYGPGGSDERKTAERAIESKDLPSYLGGAAFQNGSACFRLHVGHSAWRGCGGGRAAAVGAAAAAATRGCCSFLAEKKENNNTWNRFKQEKQPRSGFSSIRGSRRATGSFFLRDRWWNSLLHRSRATLLFMQREKLHKSYSRVAMLRLDK